MDDNVRNKVSVVKKNRRVKALLLDLIVSTVASFLAMLYVRWTTEPVFEFGYYLCVWILCGAVSSLVAMLVFRTHKIVMKHATVTTIAKLLCVAILKELILAALVFTDLIQIGGLIQFKMLILVSDFLITFLSLVITRIMVLLIYKDLKDSLDNNIDRVPVMIYGTSEKSVSMVLRLQHSAHYVVKGYLSRNKINDGLIAMDCKCYYFDDELSFEQLKINLGFQSIIFVKEEDCKSESQPDGLVQMCFRHGVQCLTAPKIDQVDFGGISKDVATSVVNSFVDYIPDGMSSFERNTKRIVDFLLASVLLVVFSPLFLICYIALKKDDGGPAIYKQERIGRFGRPFYIYKFRSMKVDAESAGPALYSGDDDPRLTKVGKFLRLHHLDELPQLYNVWKGDMAFVGPRPERKFYIDQIMERDPRYYFLYQIRPGVTSYATLKNGYTDTMDKMLRRLEYDLYYLRHRSWWFDIKVLWQTFVNIVFGKIF